MDSDLVRNLLGIQPYLIEEQSGLEFIPISSKDSLNCIYIYIYILSPIKNFCKWIEKQTLSQCICPNKDCPCMHAQEENLSRHNGFPCNIQ